MPRPGRRPRSTVTPPGDGSGSTCPAHRRGHLLDREHYDIATNMPGTAGAVINGFIQATDDAGRSDEVHPRPADRAAARRHVQERRAGLGASSRATSTTACSTSRRTSSTRILDIGDKFGQVASTSARSTRSRSRRTARRSHTVTGVHFKVDQEELDFLFKDYGIADVKVTGRRPSRSTRPAAHGGGPQGAAVVWRDAPPRGRQRDHPDDRSRGGRPRTTCCTTSVELPAVGHYVYDAVGIGSASTFETACNARPDVRARTTIYRRSTTSTASALEFGIAASRRPSTRTTTARPT